MRAEEMIGWMNETVTDNKERVSELSNLVEEYPYFQTAHVLFAQYLKAGKDSRFQTELRKTACYASDRTKLFYLIENEVFPAKKIAQLEKEDTEFNSPFDWIDDFLLGKEPKQKTEEKPIAAAEPIIETPIIETPAATDYMSFVAKNQSGQETAPMATLQHQDLIDTFLKKDQESNLKIKRQKENESSPEDYPLDSGLESEEPDFLSLTLVKIYIRQKKYNKALENLHKLNLIYPEKNRYFADQFRFLEKLIHNKKK